MDEPIPDHWLEAHIYRQGVKAEMHQPMTAKEFNDKSATWVARLYEYVREVNEVSMAKAELR